jgi:hypothetical protein
MEASLANLWRPLGVILIERDLLTEEQLDVALTEQQRSGRRLGEVLVDLELVPRDVLISVLLEQCGLDAETQNGFGSGLLNELRKRGSAHRRAVPLQVVADVRDPEPAPDEDPEAPAPEPEEADEPEHVVEPRRRWRRRKADRDDAKHSEHLAAVLSTVETWAADLQSQIAEMRSLIDGAAR